jgi:hypothetical protein
VTEERGIRLWLPWTHNTTLPASLPVWHIVERDEEGLAAIVDSMFLLPEQLTDKHEKILPSL